MHRISISLDECRTGCVLAKDIINEKGIILAARNTVINPFILRRLREIGITSIYIYDCGYGGNRLREGRKRRILRSNYSKALLTVKDLIGNLAVGKRPDPEKIDMLAETIFSNIDNVDCTIGYLSELRDYDDYTFSHSVNVAFYAMLICKWTHMSAQEIKDAIISGCLHDIGKMAVPNEILNKSGRLTESEFNEIKEHSNLGYEMLRNDSSFDDLIKDAVRSHHERMDGSGYPSGISASGVGKYARVIAIADVYDAVTSNRVYKRRDTPFEAFRIFISTGLSKFDPYMMMTFLSNIAAHLVGLKVKMSDGQVGEIAYVPPHDITNPVVSIDNSYFDLSKEKSLKILDVL